MTWVRSSPPDIVRVAYVDLVVTDLDRRKAFWVDLLGFHVTAPSLTPCTSGYEEFVHHSVVLRAAASWRAASASNVLPQDLDLAERLASGLRHAACSALGYLWPGPGGAGRRPARLQIELVHEMDKVERLVQRYDLRRGVGINRIDHVNIAVPDVPLAFEHYTSLGFGLSETIEDLSDGTLFAAWMFRKQTVHDISLHAGAGPMLHHVAFAVPESRHPRPLRPDGSARHGGQHGARPGRHGVERLLPVRARRRRPPHGGVHVRLLHRGPRPRAAAMGRARGARRDFWANPIVPTWYQGSVGVLDLAGNRVAVEEQDAPSERRVTVGADASASLVGQEE